MKLQSILQTVGRTPHVRINRLFPKEHEVWIKLEKNNPSNSIKDRISIALIEGAEKNKFLKKDSIIVEPTSGNTGISLSMVSAVKGYRLILVVPESMSIERRYIMSTFGAELVLTSKEKGMKGALEKAKDLYESIPNAWMAKQFNNKLNIYVHKKKTAREILDDFSEGFDYFITGVGTGGHIMGITEILKKRFPNMKIIAVEPKESAVISGNISEPHEIQGIGAGFVPDILDINILDEIFTVSKEEAFEYAKRAAKEEGLFVGISTGAALAAVNKKISEILKPSKFLTINYDTGERYLSVESLFKE